MIEERRVARFNRELVPAAEALISLKTSAAPATCLRPIVPRSVL